MRSGTVPIRAERTGSPAPTRSACPSRANLSLDLPVGSGTPQPGAIRRVAPGLAAAAGDAGAFRRSPATSCGSRSRCRRASTVGKPYLFPLDRRRGRLCRAAELPPHRRHADRRAARARARAEATFAACSRSATAAGSSSAPSRALCPRGGSPIGELGRERAAVGGARRDRRRHAAQPDAVRVPDPRAEGAAPVASGRERSARRGAMRLAYAAGAIVGTGALGVALLAIRAAGAEAGWAFQLQDPRTIMLLLLLAAAITANLLGLFELPVLGGGARPAGSFGTGALAAFVATPCAGPFLGAALGTALLLPAAGSVRCSPRSGWPGAAVPRWSPSFRRCSEGCRSPAAGWSGCSASSRSRWRRRAVACLVAALPAGGQSARFAVGAIAVAALCALLRRRWSAPAPRRGAAPGSSARGLAAAGGWRSLLSLRCQSLARVARLVAGAEPWSEARGRARPARRASRCSSISPPTGA